MYDDSAGQTMTKGTELAESENYEKARQYFDAAIRRDPKSGLRTSVVHSCLVINKNGLWPLGT
jgi:hypothetical protein